MGLIPNAITIAIVEKTDTARLNPKPKICSIMFGFTPLFWIFYPAPPYQRRQISYTALTSLFQFCDIIPEPVKKRKFQNAEYQVSIQLSAFGDFTAEDAKGAEREYIKNKSRTLRTQRSPRLRFYVGQMRRCTSYPAIDLPSSSLAIIIF